MFHLTQSNRFEYLLDCLLAKLEAEAPGPFEAQTVIVPSTALRRRVELAQAERAGVCANLEFAFLARWLWRQIGRVVTVAEDSPFAPPVLAWRLHELLADPALAAAHPRLGSYLAGADALMRYDLARAVAGVMDHYLTYRADWLAAWSAGRAVGLGADEDWQADLWRRVAIRLGAARQHPMHAFFEAVEASASTASDFSLSPRERAGVRDRGSQAPLPTAEAGRQGKAAPGARSGSGMRDRASQAPLGLPRSAHLFCLHTLPPLYLEILRRLSRWMDLHLYVLNPCREYWFEIVDAKRLAYLAVRQQDLYQEVGNSLLAAWGRQAKAQLELLFDDDGLIQDEGSAFFQAEGKTLLARVQNAILDLAELAPGSVPLAAGDRSIEVHVCHSLTRELEVLHDQLLALLAGPKPPRPSDIVVLTPDLDAAAPLIEAVFGTAPPERRIPFVITGRGAVGTSPMLRAVDALLDTVGSRALASEVLDLLQLAPIARRFGLAPEDLPRIHAWLGEAGIRWGLDESARTNVLRHFEASASNCPDYSLSLRERAGVREGTFVDLPAEGGGHSFAAGLERLFLAYALGDDEPGQTELFAGRLPAGNPEGSAALALGAWWRFVEALRQLDRALSRPLDANGWRAALLDLADRFLAEDREWADDLRALRAAIVELHAQMTAGSATRPQPLAVIHAALSALLDEPARGGTPSGAVTFSAIASLRHLPYRVVCLVGLNDGAFPGAARPAEFDLMARHPRRGDRQRGEDERNLFLDALLAARERLYLSYTGRSIRDASALPASVLVEELLDYLAAATAADPADPASLAAARQRFVVEHPLQAFSPVYFLAPLPPLQGEGRGGDGVGRQDRSGSAHPQPHPPPSLPLEGGGTSVPDPRLFSFNAEYCAALRARLDAAIAVNRQAEASASAGPDPSLSPRERVRVRDRGPQTPLPAAEAGRQCNAAPGARSGAGVRDSGSQADEEADETDEPLAPSLFFPAPLPPPGVEWRAPGLDDLLRFFRGPSRYLLQRRLGLRLEESGESPADEEPFLADWPGRQALARRLLRAALAGRGEAELLALARAGGEFPAGALGETQLRQELAQLAAYAARLAPALAEPLQPALVARLDFELAGEAWTLEGALSDLRTSGLVRHRYDEARAGDYLEAWLAHLFLCACAPEGVAPRSLWHARDGAFALAPCAEPRARLAELLALYREGLAEPLPFFPKSAWRYVESDGKLNEARKCWHNAQHPEWGESAQPAHRLALRGRADPLDARFEAVARTVFGPLLAHLEPVLLPPLQGEGREGGGSNSGGISGVL